MKTEPIPEKILNALSSFLDNQTGGLKSDADLKKFLRCMSQQGESMIHICTYLNIIKATDNDEVAFSLLELGLWKTLYTWLSDYKNLEDTPMIILLLDVFKTVPVTTELLKSTKSAKIIKSLSKHEEEEVSEPSQMIVDKWMKIIKSKSSTDDSNHKEHKEKKKKHSTESGEIKSSSPDNSEKHKSKHRHEKEENGTVRPTTNRHEHKERSAGVEEGIIKPKSRVDKKKEDDRTQLLKKSAALPIQLSAQKRAQPELPKIEPESIITKRFKVENDKNEMELGRVKIIPPPARPKQETELDGFMAALKPAPRTQLLKKRKPTPGTNGRSATSPPLTPTSPSLPAPPSFYKDTLAGHTSVPVSPPRNNSTSPTENMDTTVTEQPQSGDDNSNSSQADTQGVDKNSAFPDLPETNGKKKRSIHWADDATLVQIHYFDLVDDERVNVNRVKAEGRSDLLKDSFGVKAMAASHIQENEKNTWRRPVLIDLPEKNFPPGRESKERDIQAARESTVLQTVYFAKQLIPESASDPIHDEDILPSSSYAPREIPLEFTDGPIESHPPIEQTTPNSGYSDDVMETIQQLVKGEAEPGLIAALTKTNPADLSKIISQVGPSSNEDDSQYQNFPPNSFQTIDDQENWSLDERHDGRQGNERGWRGRGRGDFRGRGRGFNNNRGRGNWRGRGVYNGPTKICHHFQRLGRCDFGNACKFSHDLTNAV